MFTVDLGLCKQGEEKSLGAKWKQLSIPFQWINQKNVFSSLSKRILSKLAPFGLENS